MSALAVEHDELVEQCLNGLRALPFVREAELSTADEGSPVVHLTTPSGAETLPCEIRRTHLQREAAQFLVHLARESPGLVILAPAVGREVGELFEDEGVNFVDRAGNCHLRLGDEYIGRIQGRTAPKPKGRDRGLRAAAYRALFTLLVRPELIDASARALAAEADVSPQTANDLRHRLIDRGWVLETRHNRVWAPGRWTEVLSFWLSGFATTLAPSLLIGRFRTKEQVPAELEARVEPILRRCCDWRYGGGAAAARLTEYYRGEQTVIYVRNAPGDLVAQLGLARDPAGPVVLLRPPGTAAFESPHPQCVHPLLAYADLLMEDHERARDAAQELYERYLSTPESAT